MEGRLEVRGSPCRRSSRAASVLVVAHNHLAVELLLLFLECVFHLFPLKATIPRKEEERNALGFIAHMVGGVRPDGLCGSLTNAIEIFINWGGNNIPNLAKNSGLGWRWWKRSLEKQGGLA